MSNGFETCDKHTYLFATETKDCPYCRIDELEQQIVDERHDCADLALQVAKLEQQLAEWHNVFGHLSKDADTAGNMINEGIAERDAEIEYLNKKVTNLKACIESWVKEFTIKHQQLATSQQEVERLKEESSHLWVRIESGEAAAYEQGKFEARKQAAQEIIEDVIGEWNCECGLVIADVLQAQRRQHQ